MCFLDKLADSQRLEVQGSYWPVLGWWLELRRVGVWSWGPRNCGRPEEFCQEVGVGSWEGNVLIPSYQVHACVLSHVSRVRLSVTPSTAARQAPLSMGFSRPECWNRLPCPPPGDLPDPGIESVSVMSPALPGGFFTTSAAWEASYQVVPVIK